VVDQSASIIGMSVMSAQAAQTGIMNYAFLVASISISLGLMNLLPIPPLDGGKIVLELIQRAMRRPVPQSIQVGLSMFGICLLLVFMFYVMFQDVLRLAG
ncbi:MAG: site-2 protease family protein, partial [Coriobacteriia bacterium]|nr:site-2 protease family protein [Coriobacteriia bacterium]